MSDNGNSLTGVIQVLNSVLQLAEPSILEASTRLLGGIPEFDSMAVASVVIGVEEHFGLEFDDDDINAELFETVGTLAAFVDRLRNPAVVSDDGPRPDFLSATSGSLFVLVHDAEANARLNPESRCVVFVAPFAEEMNRVRPLITATAKKLNRAGLSCCNFDFYGTGDSEGDFIDARWSLWMTDLHDVVSRLRIQGFRSIDLVGIRLGALLALEYANAHENQIARIVIWDPVFDGNQYINRFLRTRTMAAMMSGKSESVKELRARLDDGHPVEVGGYELHPDLVAAIAGIGPSAERELSDTVLFWMTQDQSADVPGAAAAMSLHLGAWRKLEYEAYWASAEPTEVSALIDATCECLAGLN